MATWNELVAANATIKTTNIKGKDYAEVNQRIKAFRMVYPEGFIRTTLISDADGLCIFKAEVGFFPASTTEAIILGTGHAYEKEGATQINRTSYIENCETSAVGRALGMAGFGIDTSVASAEEVTQAIAQQEAKATPKQLEILIKTYTGDNLSKLLAANGIERIEDIPMAKASELIQKLTQREA